VHRSPGAEIVDSGRVELLEQRSALQRQGRIVEDAGAGRTQCARIAAGEFEPPEIETVEIGKDPGSGSGPPRGEESIIADDAHHPPGEPSCGVAMMRKMSAR